MVWDEVAAAGEVELCEANLLRRWEGVCENGLAGLKTIALLGSDIVLILCEVGFICVDGVVDFLESERILS